MRFLVFVLIIAAFFRFTGINWDEGVHNHPDERHLSFVLNKVSIPASIHSYFDTSNSPLNPLNVGFKTYVYGTFPLVLVKIASSAVGYGEFNKAHLVGRALSALFDTLSTLLVFLIGSSLYSRREAILASLLYACAVLCIQQSHFFVVDTFALCFALASFYFSLKIVNSPKFGNFVGAGIFGGLALSCKVSILPFLFLPFLAGALATISENDIIAPVKEWKLNKILGRLVFSIVSLISAFVVFRVLQPYAFSTHSLYLEPRFVADLRALKSLSSAPSLFPPSMQWIGRDWWYPIENIIKWGMGPALGLSCIAGVAYGVYCVSKSNRSSLVLPLLTVSLIVSFHSMQYVKVMRYFLPAYPLLILMGSAFLLSIPKKIGIFAVGFVTVFTFLWALAFTSIYRSPFVRSEASRWISSNLSEGSIALVEHWDDPLPVGNLRRKGTPLLERLKVFEPDSLRKREEMATKIASADYIFINSKRGYGSIPRNQVLFPTTTLYYELLFKGELGFKLEKSFSSFPRLFGIEIPTDLADESFSVYDHPRILIFKKEIDFTATEIEAKLSSSVKDRPRLKGDELVMMASALSEESK